MPEFCENLEARTLFSAGNIGAVTTAYDAVVADATALKVDYLAAASTYKSDAKIIAADIKALGKSKTNTTDIAALTKADTSASALDTKITSKLIAVGKAALIKAKAAFSADVAHPTTANGLKLSNALTTLTTALAPYESSLSTASATGNTNVDAALSALVSANPTDTTLSTDVSLAETKSSNALATLSSELTITNEDINTLAADIA